ncbi:prolyl oligopeptidase family serine peptidase [bacterium]|nr:prolyl oligopeptidase family serine peptidase [bacterium]
MTSERMVWMEYTDARNALYYYLKDMGQARMRERAEGIADIQSLTEWKIRQDKVDKTLHSILGPFPVKTALNAKIVGRLERPDFEVEKILYESMPGFHVTGCLFLPKKREDKAPAILFCSGHSNDGFRAEHYQNVILNLVNKGFIVFAFDPIGQGERLQYFEEDAQESKIGGSTKEHSYVNNQCFISGRSVARYFTWDGIRALDYLASRPEVDADRLGCHGLSGGGTQTAYISSIDKRFKAVAIAGYITQFEWLLKTQGVGDGEQNLYQSWAHGIDLPDYVQVQAPRPLLMMVTTRDFFPIRGARNAYRESLGVYNAYHRTENLQIVEDDYRHGYTQKTRETLYAFFQKHLENTGDTKEQNVDLFTVKELRVTDTGQVSTSLNSETVFSINREETNQLLEDLKRSRSKPTSHLESVLKEVPKVSGYQDPTVKPVDAVLTGRYNENGIIEKRFIEGVGDYPIPFLVMIPEQIRKNTVILYLDPEGKNVQSESQFFYKSFLDSGHIVVIPDLINTGEVGPTEYNGDATINGISSNIWYMAVQNAVSIAGIRAADVNRLAGYLSQRFPDRKIAGASRGDMNAVLLHASVMNPQIKALAMLNPLVSYESIVMNRYYSMEVLYSAPGGVLKGYDLPDLAACLAPNPILMMNPVDQNLESVSQDQINNAYHFTRHIYQNQNAGDDLIIKNRMDESSIQSTVSDWLD